MKFDRILPLSVNVNPSNAHVTNLFGSTVGGVSGCGGAGGSAAALAANPGYNIIGGKNGAHRRGGSKRSNKRYKRSNKRYKRSNKRSNKGGGGTNVQPLQLVQPFNGGKRRSKRGGLSALNPTQFSGAANAPYHQFMGGQPVSYNYGLGVNAPIPPSESWMASPPPLNNVQNNCGLK